MDNFSVIVACAKDTRVIGKNGKMPWHLPLDLKYFKARTIGQVVIMGRKTYESIGKPLPNRLNIVITRDKKFKSKAPIGVLVYESIEGAFKSANTFKDKETIVIGGGQIYKQVMEMRPHRIYVTWVDRFDGQPIKGDTTFPEINTNQYKVIDTHDIGTPYSPTSGEFNLVFTTYEIANGNT